MNVGRKLMLIVVASVALVIIPAAAGIYLYLKQNLLAAEASTLTSETQTIVATNTQTLLGYEFSLKALSSTLEKTLSEPPKVGEAAAFDRLVQRDLDHAWRNRHEGFDGRIEAGIFLPPDAPLDAEQKSLHLRSKNLLDIYGTSITGSYENIWLLTKDRTEIIYDHLYPEFAQLMKADTDYTKTPWLTLGDPAINPKREVRWTPPMLDPVSNSWVVSAVLPVDVNGRWIGTIGRDISLTKALPTLMQKGNRYSGEERFLMDAQGNYIDAGPWQKQLVANPDKFKVDLTKEPELAVLLKHKESNLSTHIYDKYVTLNGKKYLAIDAPMPYLDWRYTRLVPIDEILAPVRQLFYSLIGIVLAIGLLIGFLIDVAVQRNIINRLQILADAVRRYGLGDTKARANLLGNDELAKTSQEFDMMVKRIDANEQELNLIMENMRGTVSRVDNNQRYVFVSKNYMVIFAKPMEQIVGHTMREIIGEDLYAQEEPYIKRVLAGEAVNFEIKTPVLNLGEMHGLVHFIPNFDDKNKVDGFFITVVDITEHKKIQQDLLERDARWKFAIEGFGDCLWDTDEVARTITYSNAWFDITGHAEGELSNNLDEWESRIHPDDKEATLANLQDCLDGKTLNYECNHRVLCKDGSYKWIHDRGIVLNRSVSGKALRMVGTASDITERKSLESIRESEQSRIQKIASRLRGVVYEFRLNPDGSSCFPYASEAIKQIYRVSPEEVRQDASKVFAIIHPDDYESIVASIQESAKNLSPWRTEYRVRFNDGTVRWLNGNAMPEREDSGATLWHGYIADITERKQIEQDLIKSEERWKFAIEGSGDGIWDWNIQTDEAVFSSRWKSMLGYLDDEITGTGSIWLDLIHPEDLANINQALQLYLEGKSPVYHVEFRMRCKDLSYKWIKARGIVISHTQDGKPLRMLGTHTDITEQKQSEIDLSIAATAFESQESIMITDANKIMVRVNAAFTQTTGYTPEEVIGQSPRMLSSGLHDADFYKIMWESINKTGTWSGEVWNKRKNGEIYPEQLTISAVKDSNGVVTFYVGSLVDITARKKIEQELIDSEYRWKFAIEGSGDGVWDWDIKSNTIVHSSRWKEMLGYAPSDEVATDEEWENRIHPDDKEYVEESLHSYLNGKTSIYQVECRLKCNDGSYKWILGRGMVVNRDENGKPLRMIGTHTDISERKRTEEALIESEYRSKFAIEGSGDGVWDVNIQTNAAVYSKRWAEMLGYEQGEILPSRDDWRALIHPDDQQLVLDSGNAYLEGKTEIYLVEYRIRCKNGDYKWMLSRGMLVSRTEDGRPLRMIGTQIDITERKLAEEKVKRMQRELLESHERYVDLYEFAPIGYLSVTKHGMITEVNWKVTAMLGQQRKDINQHRFEEFVAEEDKGFWRRQFTMIKELQEGEDITLSLKLSRADGSIFIANLHCLRMEEGDDEPILRVTLEDVTQLKQSEQVMQLRESYQRSLLDNFPFMVWLKDSKHRYLAVNQFFANACGFASQDLLPGSTDIEVWPKELAKKYRADDIEVIKSGETRAVEEVVDINGRKVWFETYRSPVTIDGNVVGTVGFARDIDDRKRAEMFEHFRSHILELLIDDLTLHNILEAIALGVEGFNPEMLCSILLIDLEGKHLINAAAPSLPTFYNSAVDGIEIGMNVGSCGTAAFIKQRVVVEDISTHPYWDDYKELAKNSGLAACWSQPIFAPNGKVLGTFAIYHRNPNTPSQADIKLIEQTAYLASIAIERKQAEDDLRIASIAFESQEGMMVTDAKNIILKVNQAFCDITGYTSAEAVGHTPRLLSSSQHSEGFYDAMWECVHATGHWAGEVYNRRKNGEVFPQHLTVTVVKDANGVVTNHVATLTDITMNKAAAEEIKHLAFYDPLTGLPNRRLMVDRLNQALVFNARTGRDGAVLFLDLDHFKTLNDSLGHDVGDMLLQQVAARLVSCVREGDTVARLGGDEYVVLLEDLSEEAPEAATQVEAVGEKILAALNQAYQLGQHEYHCTPSIGVALFSNHNQSQEELLKHADIAMYQAKKAGRNTIRFFDPKMQEVINTRVDLERELRKALDKHQLHLYYQIQVDVSGRPMGAEALTRWLHPEHGLVSPFHFIPLAEETGLILPIGQWVLETACKQLKLWEQDAITRDLTLSINVSAKQFRQADFVNQIHQAVKRFGINPMLLKLELTESMLLDNIEDTVTTMNKLKEVGIRFSLDDFGTGYSSLQYLKRLPLYQLKIDQSFVRDIAVDSSDQAIVRTIIAMAHTLNLNVIAEGVETEEQQGLLLNNGCTHYQGYFYGRPVPIEQFEVLLRT